MTDILTEDEAFAASVRRHFSFDPDSLLGIMWRDVWNDARDWQAAPTATAAEPEALQLVRAIGARSLADVTLDDAIEWVIAARRVLATQ